MIERNPQDPRIHLETGITYSLLKEFGKAEKYLLKAETLAPDQYNIYSHQVFLHLRSTGNTDHAQAVIDRFPGTKNYHLLDDQFRLHLCRRDLEKCLTVLSDPLFRAPSNQMSFAPMSFMEGQARFVCGQRDESRPYLERAVNELNEHVQANTEDHRAYSTLGLAYAMLGDKENALRNGQLGTEKLPLARDMFLGAVRVVELVVIEALVGETEKAIKDLETILSQDTMITVPFFEIMPGHEPLRDNPAYLALLQKYDHRNK